LTRACQKNIMKEYRSLSEAMNISRGTLLGKILRLPLDLLPKKMVVPILRGRMRGMKWIKGAGAHGYWLGTYEYDKRIAFEKGIKPGDVFYDIGANVGYYSLMAARLSEPNGEVIAFEPLPRNIAFIHKHVTLNKLSKRIKVIEAAVSDKNGKACFNLSSSTSKGHIAGEGELEVRTVSLDELVESGEILAPDVMKVDVEGAEAEVLLGAYKILSTRHPLIYLDTHDRNAHNKTVTLLNGLGYTITCVDGKDLPESKELLASF
ncbi:MAG: FkbM family methyltransferase, partial [Anaerolineaceae bacterium]|nr:FkbM family methyltransferase [Anaerolineaceae bacterium]